MLTLLIQLGNTTVIIVSFFFYVVSVIIRDFTSASKCLMGYTDKWRVNRGITFKNHVFFIDNRFLQFAMTALDKSIFRYFLEKLSH